MLQAYLGPAGVKLVLDFFFPPGVCCPAGKIKLWCPLETNIWGNKMAVEPPKDAPLRHYRPSVESCLQGSHREGTPQAYRNALPRAICLVLGVVSKARLCTVNYRIHPVCGQRGSRHGNVGRSRTKQEAAKSKHMTCLPGNAKQLLRARITSK